VSARGPNAKYPRPDQVAGAYGLVTGHIVEMLTGEGKTLAGAVAALVKAVESRTPDGAPAPGRGVWWLTPNDALAMDAYREVARIGRQLGITVDVVTSGRPAVARWKAYRADVTIGGAEMVFDALRDRSGQYAAADRKALKELLDEARTGDPVAAEQLQALMRDMKKGQVQAGRGGFLIFDEVDAFLIDDANMPFRISEVIPDGVVPIDDLKWAY